MLFARRNPDDVAGPDFFFRTALALHPAMTRRDDERLAERMRVPRGARAGLEGDDAAANPRRSAAPERQVDPDRRR